MNGNDRFDRANLQPVVTLGGVKVYDWLAGAQTRFINSLEFSHNHDIRSDEVGRAPLIAARQYGSISYWWIICYYNGIIDPKKELVAGMRLRIPSAASMEDYLRTATQSARSRVISLP
jgi:hypothetical protein